MIEKQPLVLLGRFGAPHGVRGAVRLQSYTQEPLAIGSYGPLTDKSGARRFALTQLRPQGKDMLVAQVEGVATREAAQALTGVALYIARDRLPAPDEDEFYLADLIGLRAETVEGAPLGIVVALRNFGAGDILEIAPSAQGPAKSSDVSDEAMRRNPGAETLLFPFTKTVVPRVDVAGGRVVVAPPVEVEASSPDNPRSQ